MQLRWTKRALRQFTEAQDYIAEENPAAARQVAQRIVNALGLLMVQPKIGRNGRIEGSLEWVVQKTPYIIVYRVKDDALSVVRLIHSKQYWPVPAVH